MRRPFIGRRDDFLSNLTECTSTSRSTFSLTKFGRPPPGVQTFVSNILVTTHVTNELEMSEQEKRQRKGKESGVNSTSTALVSRCTLYTPA